MTKMDWDRVHSEDLTRRQLAKYGRKKKGGTKLSTLKRKRKRTLSSKASMPGWNLSGGAAMPGCTCGKPVGFTGLHKTACLIRCHEATVAAALGSPSSTNFVLSDFKSAVKATGYTVLLKRLLADCAKALNELPSITSSQRKKAESSVRAMLEELAT